VSDGIFNGYRVGLGALGFSLLEVSSFPWILAQLEHGTHWIDIRGTREFKYVEGNNLDGEPGGIKEGKGD
jgi:hypothetical protein